MEKQWQRTVSNISPQNSVICIDHELMILTELETVQNLILLQEWEAFT